MRIHELFLKDTIRYFWGTPVGGRGRVAGRPGVQHIYRVERGTPGDITDWNRRYWQPWSTWNQIVAASAICGTFRTQARWPPEVRGHWWNRPPHCEACRETAIQQGITVSDLQSTVAQDPYMIARNHANGATVTDPITGL